MTQVSTRYDFDDYRYRLPPSTLYYLHLLLRLEGNHHRTWTLDWNRETLTEQEEEMVSGSCLVALLYLREEGVVRLEPGRRWLFGASWGAPHVYRERPIEDLPKLDGLEATFAHAPIDTRGVEVGALVEEVLDELDAEPWRGVLSVQQTLLSDIGILRPKNTAAPRDAFESDVRLVPNMAMVAKYASEAERVAASLAVFEEEEEVLCKGIRREIRELL